MFKKKGHYFKGCSIQECLMLSCNIRIFEHGQNKVIDFVEFFFFFYKIKFIQVSFKVTLCNKYLRVV